MVKMMNDLFEFQWFNFIRETDRMYRRESVFINIASLFDTHKNYILEIGQK